MLSRLGDDIPPPLPGAGSFPSISVIVPVFNEVESIGALIAEIVAAASIVPIREIVYVDDGSTDGTLLQLQLQMRTVEMLRVIRHGRRLGQSASFLSGARAASQELLVFMDGDLQNDPADIAELYRRFIASKANHSHNRNDAYARTRGLQNFTGCVTDAPGSCVGQYGIE